MGVAWEEVQVHDIPAVGTLKVLRMGASYRAVCDSRPDDKGVSRRYESDPCDSIDEAKMQLRLILVKRLSNLESKLEK